MSNRSAHNPVFIEVMESRLLLSAAPGVHHPAHHAAAAHHSHLHVKHVKTPAAMNAIAAVANAGSDPIYLQIDGVNGEVTDKNFPNAIQVLSYQSGVTAGSIRFAAGGSASRANFSNVTITKNLDTATPVLLTDLVTGKVIPQAKFSFVKTTDSGSVAYLQVTLTNVTVTSENLSSGGDRPTESLSLNFQKEQMTYTPQNADGRLGTPIVFTWNGSNFRAA